MSRTVVRPRWGIPLALPHLVLSLGLVAFVAMNERGGVEPAPSVGVPAAAAHSAPVASLALADLTARP